MNSEYRTINNFGPNAANAPVNNPLTYILSSGMDNFMLHGSNVRNAETRHSQAYMAQYCASNFDGICEHASNNMQKNYFPSMVQVCSGGGSYQTPLGANSPGQNFNPRVARTKGDVLLLNTAKTKYLYSMRNGTKTEEPYDYTVAASPKVTLWVGEALQPFYAIPRGREHLVDSDIVMKKLLERPWLCVDFLNNMYCTMRKLGTLKYLQGTKLGGIFSNARFQKLGCNF